MGPETLGLCSLSQGSNSLGHCHHDILTTLSVSSLDLPKAAAAALTTVVSRSVKSSVKRVGLSGLREGFVGFPEPFQVCFCLGTSTRARNSFVLEVFGVVLPRSVHLSSSEGREALTPLFCPQANMVFLVLSGKYCCGVLFALFVCL